MCPHVPSVGLGDGSVDGLADAVDRESAAGDGDLWPLVKKT